MQSAVKVSEANARKALEELRETGVAEVPTVRRQVNAPEVKTVAPDGDFIFPAYVTDPQRAPYCFGVRITLHKSCRTRSVQTAGIRISWST